MTRPTNGNVAEAVTAKDGEEMVRPSPPPHRSPWWIIVATGLGTGILVGLLGLLTLLFPLEAQVQPEIRLHQGIAMVALGAGLALLSGGMGMTLRGGQPSSPFFPRRTWPLWLALLVLLVIGLSLSAWVLLLPVWEALLSTLAMALLPAVVLASVGRTMEGQGGTWRDVLGGLIAGASLGTGAAAVIELGLLVMGVLIIVAVAFLSGRAPDLGGLIERLQDPRFLADPQNLAGLFSPLFLLVALLGFAGVVPLVEETTKTLGVGLLGRWLRPHPARAFLLGIASGAGFALAENVLNVSLLGGSAWAPAVLSRLAATLMHCATGGLMGWGWGQLWSRRKLGHLLLAYLGSVGVHGLWNGLAVGALVSGLVLVERPSDPFLVLLVGGAISAIVVALALLAATSLGGTLWAARLLARRFPYPEGTPGE